MPVVNRANHCAIDQPQRHLRNIADDERYSEPERPGKFFKHGRQMYNIPFITASVSMILESPANGKCYLENGISICSGLNQGAMPGRILLLKVKTKKECSIRLLQPFSLLPKHSNKENNNGVPVHVQPYTQCTERQTIGDRLTAKQLVENVAASFQPV